MVAAPVTGDTTFSFGTAKALFRMNVTGSTAEHEISKDGQRILTNELPPTGPGALGARLMQNGPAALNR